MSLLSLLLLIVPARASEPYALDVQDRVRVYVAEWPALNVEVAVGANGSVALPLIGEIPARGLAPAELASTIATQLQEKSRQRKLPDVSIDIVGYRPFYILGSVTTPGEYAYRPEMLVVNAVSIASGIYRAVGISEWDLARTSISGMGEAGVAELRQATLRAEQIRYEAEVNERSFPPTPSDASPEFVRALAEQRELFEASQASHGKQTETLEAMVGLHQAEIESIVTQLETVGAKLLSYEEEVTKATRLEDAGLATNRRLPLQRDVFDIQREKRQLEFEKVRAERAVQEARLRIETLQSARKASAQEGLQRTHAMIRETEQQLATLGQLVAGATAQSGQISADNSSRSQPQIRYTIIRGRDDAMRHIEATEVTPVLPGDIIKVELSSRNGM
ncbi:polysaccharide biosynthesis/export family protein [Allorhizobium sp. NPDC080224]|uniref:polysaccharide biosynthesis/export family protein n=1 Tax=Allorhizobium sp. NPDC080224 TaxID=3390547 RepID=UPI003D0066D1